MNNLDQLDNVLDSIETQKKRAAWRNILDRLEKIEKAHDKGMSYAEMAKLMNITTASFSIALKKAKAEYEKEKAVKSTNEKRKVKTETGGKSGVLNLDELSPPPGIKKQNTNYLPNVPKL